MELIGLVFPMGKPPLEEVARALIGFDDIKLSRSDLDQPPDGIVVEKGDDYARLEDWWRDESVEEIRNEIEEEWPPELLPLPRAAGFLDLQYHRWMPLPKLIVVALAKQYDFLVDTGNDEIYSSRAFATRFHADPEWSWDPPLEEMLLQGRMSEVEKEEWRRQHPRPRYPVFYDTWPPT
jgi:hypothetical protein